MQTIPQAEALGTLTFDAALHQVSAVAHAKLPESLHGRLERATALVLEHGVWFDEDGQTCRVRASDGQHWYSVNGHCICADAHGAPEGLCKHRLAKALYQRASTLVHEPQQPVSAALAESPTETPAHHGIPAQYVTMIQGKRFIRHAGLLVMAHERGLTSLKTVFTYNDAALSLAECTAVFPFGTFTDVGDASPDNVTKKVAPHFRRVAATRATARALRQALNIDMVALEEVAEGE